MPRGNPVPLGNTDALHVLVSCCEPTARVAALLLLNVQRSRNKVQSSPDREDCDQRPYPDGGLHLSPQAKLPKQLQRCGAKRRDGHPQSHRLPDILLPDRNSKSRVFSRLSTVKLSRRSPKTAIESALDPTIKSRCERKSHNGKFVIRGAESPERSKE